MCERSFHSVRRLEQHQQRQRHYGCSVCESLFPTLMALELHKETLDHWTDYELNVRKIQKDYYSDSEDELEEHRVYSNKGRDELKRLLLWWCCSCCQGRQQYSIQDWPPSANRIPNENVLLTSPVGDKISSVIFDSRFTGLTAQLVILSVTILFIDIIHSKIPVLLKLSFVGRKSLQKNNIV